MSTPGCIPESGIPKGVLGEQRKIAVIPAKRDSKRCLNKNWRYFLADECLAERAVNKAIGTGFFNNVVLTVDFPSWKVPFLAKPRNIVMKIGLTVHERPRFLGKDSVDVLIDALNSVKANDNDIYCLLQPTSPFVTVEHIRDALKCVQSSRSKLVSVNPAYKPNGGIYAGLVFDLKTYHDLYRPSVTPLVMDWAESIDIDEEYDFEIARCLYE